MRHDRIDVQTKALRDLGLELKPRNGSRFRTRAVGLLILATTTVCALRLLRLIDVYAVNVLYWDLWDTHQPFFRGAGAWEVFRFQHGPHRLGLGHLLTQWLATMSGMSTRVEAFAVGVVLCVALSAVLILKFRLQRKLEASDAILPLAVLTLLQWEAVVVPALSFGVVTILLLFLTCAAWTVSSVLMRTALVVVLHYLVITSAFGIALAPITPAILLVSGLIDGRAHRIRARSIQFAGAAAAILANVSFFVGYTNSPSADCFSWLSWMHLLIPRHMSVLVAQSFGLRTLLHGLLPVAIGAILLILYTLIFTIASKRIQVKGSETDSMALVLATLSGFTLSYAFLNALGRACLSLAQAESSRYVMLLIPGVASLYLAILTIRNVAWKRLTMAALMIAIFHGWNVPVEWEPALARQREFKLRWVGCYLKSRDLTRCNAEEGDIYPWNPELRLPKKLAYLEENRLNLFQAE